MRQEEKNVELLRDIEGIRPVQPTTVFHISGKSEAAQFRRLCDSRIHNDRCQTQRLVSPVTKIDSKGANGAAVLGVLNIHHSRALIRL